MGRGRSVTQQSYPVDKHTLIAYEADVWSSSLYVRRVRYEP
jgi:hypothetical protein